MNVSTPVSSVTGSVSEEALEQILSHLPEGVPFDAAAIVDQHPDLHDNSQFIVDLAYEEFARRQQQGETVDVERFLSRFPRVSALLRRTLEICEFIAQDPELFLKFADPGWPSVGDQLGPFLLDRQIGEGAFSRVYEARETTLGGRRVVIKLTTHVFQEADALGRLNHSQIVSPLALYSDLVPGLTAIVMPSFGRATMADLIKAHSSGPHPPPTLDYHEFLRTINEGAPSMVSQVPPGEQSIDQLAIELGTSIADALAYAHSQGFIHCDVKPSNILLGTDGKPRLLDFNLSIARDDESGVFGGTLDYMAPEHVQAVQHLRRTSGAHSKPVTGAADVFSLACTLVELLTGRPPFWHPDEHSAEEQRSRHPLDRHEGAYRLPRALPRRINARLTALLEQCLDAEPTARPSADQLVAQLRKLLPRPGWRRYCRSQRARGVMALLCVMIVFAAWMSWPPSLQARYDDGVASLMQNNDPVHAASQFTSILTSDPSRLDVRVLRACALIEAQHFEEAYADLKVLRSHSSAPEYSALIGYILCAWNRNFTVAEREFESALSQSYASVDVLNNLAVCKDRLQKHDEAIALIKRARRLSPSSFDILYNHAQMELRRSIKTGAAPDTTIADELIQHKMARDDADSCLCAAQLYFLSPIEDDQSMSRGVHCARRALELGISQDQADYLRELVLQVESSQHLQVPIRLRRPTGEVQLLSYRLLSPPACNRDFIRRLIIAATRHDSAAHSIAHRW